MVIENDQKPRGEPPRAIVDPLRGAKDMSGRILYTSEDGKRRIQLRAEGQ